MTFLLGLLALVSVVQPDGDRRAAACVFTGTALGFDFLCSELPGNLYFLAAAVSAAAGISLLRKLRPGDFVIWALARFCFASILLNAMGYLAYELYVPAAPYILLFQIFYFSAIVLLIYGGLHNGLSGKTTYLPRFLLLDRMGFYHSRED